VSPIPREAWSGLEAWKVSELPTPPVARGLSLLAIIGPGAIILGVSIGSGEWLLGPAAFIKYGLALLWVTGIAVFLQTVFNTELLRYTLYTGEPIFTGLMRTRPSSTFWAWFYSILYFMQAGWPGWAGAAAGAIFYLFAGRLAGPSTSSPPASLRSRPEMYFEGKELNAKDNILRRPGSAQRRLLTPAFELVLGSVDQIAGRFDIVIGRIGAEGTTPGVD
jgi:hypothetical protein